MTISSGLPDLFGETAGGIFFTAADLPDAADEYVLWLDVMGIESTLTHQSIAIASNFIAKLQIAALRTYHDLAPTRPFSTFTR